MNEEELEVGNEEMKELLKEGQRQDLNLLRTVFLFLSWACCLITFAIALHCWAVKGWGYGYFALLLCIGFSGGVSFLMLKLYQAAQAKLKKLAEQPPSS